MSTDNWLTNDDYNIFTPISGMTLNAQRGFIICLWVEHFISQYSDQMEYIRVFVTC